MEPGLITIREAARRLGRDSSDVSKQCRKHGFGTRSGLAILLTPDEFARLASEPIRPRGRPKKVKTEPGQPVVCQEPAKPAGQIQRQVPEFPERDRAGNIIPFYRRFSY